MSTVNIGGGRGKSLDLDKPEMGIVWTTLISAIGAGVSAGVKGIKGAVKKRKDEKKQRKQAQQAQQAQAVETLQKKKKMIGLLAIGGAVVLGAGTIFLTGRRK